MFPVIFVLPIMLFLDHSHYPRLAPKAEAPPRAPRRPFAAEAPRSALLAAFPCGFSLRRTATPGCAQIRKMKGIKMLLQFAIPRFLVRGRLAKTNCSLSAPFTGELTVVASEVRIRSLELQLVRVETITYAEGTAREATEIQNLQIGDGDVPRGLAIPLYMIFPRIFTCPTSVSDSFRVEFEVNIIVAFEDGFMVTENFPIRLYRAPVGSSAASA